MGRRGGLVPSAYGGSASQAVTVYGGGATATAITATGVAAQLQQVIANSVNIGGGGSGIGSICTGCEPNVPFVTTLIEFVSILESLKSSIDMFFPPINVGTSITGRFAAGGTMDIRLFARLEWIRLYKETEGRFDVTSVRHVTLLKDIFLSLGSSWQVDQWLREWDAAN